MTPRPNARMEDRTLIVISAGPKHAREVARLFDLYRVFYRQPSDPEAAFSFIATRLETGDSVILCAMDEKDMVGFTQLYPSFTSVGMKRIWILNDLFVAPEARRQGVGRLLLNAAVDHARATGAARLVLETEVDNRGAQALYEAEGWERAQDFYVYSLAVEG